jgi:hypothetical protein
MTDSKQERTVGPGRQRRVQKVLWGLSLVGYLGLGGIVGAGEMTQKSFPSYIQESEKNQERDFKVFNLGGVNSLSGGPAADKSRNLVEGGTKGAQRDPFIPLVLPKPEEPVRLTSAVEDGANFHVPSPGKLLSVARGPRGFQAVIQTSSKDNMVVEPGEHLGKTGWLIKEINENQVLLVWLKRDSPSLPSSSSRTMTLRFPSNWKK